MENNIPTAEDFLKENANEITYEEGEMFAADVTPYMLIEFAKMHVKQFSEFNKISKKLTSEYLELHVK